jgi:hypothetical protein
MLSPYKRKKHHMLSKLLELTQIGPSRAGVFDLPEKHWPKPGQYLPCQRITDTPDVLVTNLFRVLGDEDLLTLEPIPPDWYPGDEIRYLPPQGHAFQLPPSARRIGLLPLGVTPLRLLALLQHALAQDASLTLFLNSKQRDTFLSHVPSVVEVVPDSALTENLEWLDYLAVDLERDDLESLSHVVNIPALPFEGQVLIRTIMPCRGLGTCGVCAIRTAKGWRLICKDGPVFDLMEVLNVAQ